MQRVAAFTMNTLASKHYFVLVTCPAGLEHLSGETI